MHLKSAVVLAAAVVFVNAQETPTSSPAPTSTAGLSDCLLNCVIQAASDNSCTSFADIGCVCTNQGFQTDAASCLQNNCSQEDVQAALDLQQAQCAAVTAASSVFSSLSSAGSSVISSISSEVSSRVSSISSRISSATATGTGASSSASSSSAAMAPAEFAPGVILSVAFGAVGIIAGALLV